ncbi:MAG: conjugal transfer protein TraG N-terminal domain-containing protein [Gammaproteobacteria bacterium]
MTVESYFELFLALFGWQQYNHLWEILTGTGLAYLPFLFILLLNIIGPITSQETRDAATTSVRRMEVDLLIAFSVVVLAAAPAIDLNASVLSYKKPCDTLSGPAGTVTPGNTGTTFDAVFSEVIATPTQVPVWWWGIMAISSGINREGIAGIGCAADLSGFQLKMASTRITDPALVQELALFIRYCYRPAHSKFLRDKPGVAALQEEFGANDTEWVGSHILLEIPGYYDNPAFRPREPIRGWPYESARDTEYPQPLAPDLDPENIGRPLCNDWWEHPERGLRQKMLGVIEPEVLGAGLSFSSEFVIFEGTLTQEQVEEALIKEMVTSTRISVPEGSEIIPSLNQEGSLDLSRPFAFGGLQWERLSFAPMLYVVRAALPIFQALILSGLYALLPFALLAARYNLQGLLLLSVAIFTVKFWTYLWHLAKWLETNLIVALYPDGLSFFEATWEWVGTNLLATDHAIKRLILNFALGLMYIVLPMIFSFLMGAVGVGAVLGLTAIVTALRQPVQAGGRQAADTAKGFTESAASRRLR